MTRRARMGPIQTLGRGVDRMAPGGRRSAAESPVRPFNRPVGEAGETPAAAAPTLIGEGTVNHSSGTHLWWEPREAGDVLVAVALAQGTTLTAPAGWTLIGSGTTPPGNPAYGSTTYTWSLAYKVTAGGPGGIAGTEGTWTGITAQRFVARGLQFRGGGTPALVGSRSAGPSAWGVELVSVPAGSVAPVQITLIVPNTSAGPADDAVSIVPGSPSTWLTHDSLLLQPAGSGVGPFKLYLNAVMNMPPYVFENDPQTVGIDSTYTASLVAVTWRFT